MRTESRWGGYLRMTVMAIGALIFVLPFVWMVSTSLTAPSELFKLPPRFIPNPIDISGYQRLFGNPALPIGRWVINSVVVALAVSSLQVLTSAMAAYGFTRFSFRGRNALFAVFLATLMVPFQVMVVPLFIEMRYLGLQETYGALIIPDMASPFAVFLLRQAFLQIPREIEEAAVVDGAGHLRLFARFVVPLSKPTLATVGVFSFMGSWNNFLWPLVVIHKPSMMTLPLGLSTMSSRFVTDWNLLLAGTTVSVLPIIAVFLFAQRYILQGIAMSGLKG